MSVLTFGCRLNTYESEVIKQHISNMENVVVINTCSVTKEAERQARQEIRKIKKNNPEKKIIVTGCAAQNNPDQFLKMNEVTKVIGNHEKMFAESYTDLGQKILLNDIMSVKETANHLITSFGDKARAFIQVQNGCDHRCTFCVIPFGRGNSRSVPIAMIVKQVKVLVESGYQEIVFTGVDMTSYGKDLPGNPSLGAMTKRVLNLIPELKRLRLSSIDVAEIDEDLEELMCFEKRLMPHFHISLQSGDDMILKRMKRRHRRDQVIDFCSKIRNIRPNVAFGADLIVGFPTENDEMFENTLSLVKDAKIQYIHAFPFSAHEKVPASKMPQVDSKIINIRMNTLKTLGKKMQTDFFDSNLKTKANVLFEKDGFGHSENFLPVKFEKGLEGKISEVFLEKSDQNFVYGSLSS